MEKRRLRSEVQEIKKKKIEEGKVTKFTTFELYFSRYGNVLFENKVD